MASFQTPPCGCQLKKQSFTEFYNTKEFYYFWVGQQTRCESLIDAAVEALAIVSGPTWQKQFQEGRRVDPADGKALSLAALLSPLFHPYAEQVQCRYMNYTEMVVY